jgi:hypothetical protein
VENLGFDHILSLVLGQKHDAVGGSDDFIHRLRRKKADAAPTLRVTGWPGKAYITKFKISKDSVKSLLAHLAFRFDFFLAPGTSGFVSTALYPPQLDSFPR